MMTVEITCRGDALLAASVASLAAVRGTVGEAVEGYAASLPESTREDFYGDTVGPLNIAMGDDRLNVALQVDGVWSYSDDTLTVRVTLAAS